MLNIFSLNMPFMSEDVTNISIDDAKSLLDADIVIINPANIPKVWVSRASKSSYGKRMYSVNGSDDLIQIFESRER